MGRIFAIEPEKDSDAYISFENTGDDWDMPWEPAAAREMWSIATLYRLGKTYRVHVDDLIAIVAHQQLIAFDALAYRLAESGYDVYLSDSRLEIYSDLDENAVPSDHGQGRQAIKSGSPPKWPGRLDRARDEDDIGKNEEWDEYARVYRCNNCGAESLSDEAWSCFNCYAVYGREYPAGKPTRTSRRSFVDPPRKPERRRTTEVQGDDETGYSAYCPEHDWVGTLRQDKEYAEDDAVEHEDTCRDPHKSI